MLNTLQLQADLRKKILSLYHGVNAGHIACSLSCIDILISVLLDFKSEKDTFILSKGHAALALYVTLHQKGEISNDTLNTFYKNGTTLPAHPAAMQFPGIPFALGSLGHGFPIATGIAKANKLRNTNALSIVLMSDGETNEGTTWEAAHLAVSHQLDNLVVIIDKNQLQGFGKPEDILGDTADIRKFQTIGFECLETNGHDPDQISRDLKTLISSKNKKPKLLIANTVKGKGVSFMENKMEWHYLPMTEPLFQEAMNEINKLYA